MLLRQVVAVVLSGCRCVGVLAPGCGRRAECTLAYYRVHMQTMAGHFCALIEFPQVNLTEGKERVGARLSSRSRNVTVSLAVK